MKVDQTTRKAGLFIFVIALVFPPSFLFAEASLNKLDHILARTGGVQNFLNSPSSQQEYYATLREYLKLSEPEFPKTTFDLFLTQYRIVAEKVPTLNARMWESTGLGPSFEMNVPVRSEGRELNSAEWSFYLKKWRENLSREAGDLMSLKDLSLAEREVAIEERILPLRLAVEKQLRGGVRYARSLRAQRNADYFKALRKDPDVRKLAAFLLLEKLSEPNTKLRLESQDADIILFTVQELHDAPLAGRQNIPEGFTSAFQAYIPSKKELLAREDIFSVDAYAPSEGLEIPLGVLHAGKYQFRPFPRRFHGIWKGVYIQECIGGAQKHIAKLNPERWATVAMKDSQLLAVEHEGSHLGFVQIVPVTFAEGKANQVFGSLDLGSRIFSKKILSVHDGNLVNENFFDRWLSAYEATGAMPDGGLLVQENENSFHNSGALPMVRESLHFRFGSHGGTRKDYIHLPDLIGSLVPKIIPLAASQESLSDGRMIYPLGHPKEGPFRLLARDAVANPKKLLERLNGTKAVGHAFSQLIQALPDTPENREFLERRRQSLTDLERENVLSHLKLEAARGSLGRNSMLSMAFTIPDHFSDLFEELNSSSHVLNGQLERSLRRTLEIHMKTFPGVDIRPLLRKVTSSRTKMFLRRSAIFYAQTPTAYISATIPDLGEYTNQWRSQLDQLALQHVDVFFTLRPSTANLIQLIKSVSDFDVRMKLRELSLRHLKSADAFIHLATPELSPTPKRQLEKMKNFIDENREIFESLHPNDAERGELSRIEQARSSEEEQGFQLSNATTADEFSALMRQHGSRLDEEVFLAAAKTRFVSFRPSARAFLGLQSSLANWNLRIQIRRLALASGAIQNLEDFFLMVTMESQLSESLEDYRTEMHRFYIEALPRFLELKPKIADVKRFLAISRQTEASLEIRKYFLPLLTSAEEYLLLMKMELEHPSDDYKKALDDLNATSMSYFFALHPTLDQVVQLVNQSDSVVVGTEVRRRFLGETKTATDFIKLAKPPAQFSFPYWEAVEKVIQEFWPHFLSLNPTKENFLDIRFQNWNLPIPLPPQGPLGVLKEKCIWQLKELFRPSRE